jgi:hippurate hydrolase
VVTVGSLQAGEKENVIPDEAVIRLNVRTFDADVRTRVLSAITRIVNGEAAASGAPKPPEITPLDRYSLVTNDPDATRRVIDAFVGISATTGSAKRSGRQQARISACSARPGKRRPSSWFVGGTDLKRYAEAKQAGRVREIPTKHNPGLAPVLHPTLETGVATMVVAAHAWMAA